MFLSFKILLGKLWGIICQYFVWNWTCCDGTTLLSAHIYKSWKVPKTKGFVASMLYLWTHLPAMTLSERTVGTTRSIRLTPGNNQPAKWKSVKYTNEIDEILETRNPCYHIEAESKWTTIRRRHFQLYFFNENVWISFKLSLKFIPKGPINNIQALVQKMD